MSTYPRPEPRPQPTPPAEPAPPPTPMWMVAIGWIISLLVVAGFGFSVFMKLTHAKPDEPMPDIGWPASHVVPLAFLELFCVLLYLFPRSAVLGAILLTGYAGGAVATHARISDFDHIAPAFVLGVLVWLGLLFRDARVRALLPMRSMSPDAGSVGFASIGANLGFAVLAILFTLAGILAVVCGVAALQPADYRVERKITIDAPPEAVFKEVNDFHNWQKWSPWLKLDPNAKEIYEGPPAGKGAIFKWIGNKNVGEGSMTILESVPDKEIKIKLEFLEPFPDKANTDFTFVPKGDKTEVTWSMYGTKEFLGKVMGVVFDMEVMVGGNYEIGLANLKRVVEKKTPE